MTGRDEGCPLRPSHRAFCEFERATGGPGPRSGGAKDLPFWTDARFGAALVGLLVLCLLAWAVLVAVGA